MDATLAPVSAGTVLPAEGIRAVNFFNGRLVTSGDLRRDQDARRAGDARLGQAIGGGVVRGLAVEMHGAAGDRRLKVAAGLALNAAGQTLCLGTDQVLALVPGEEDSEARTEGGFGLCRQLTGGTYVAGDGLYVVTLAPATMPDGKAQVLALEPGNLRCNSDVVVEAVQLRLLRVGSKLLERYHLDTNAAQPRTRSLLRSAAAAACLGAAERSQALGSPGTGAGDSLVQDLLEGTVDAGQRPCDVPLALVFVDAANGILFVDRWAVRRAVSPTIAAPEWEPWTGAPLDASAQAQLAQFQEHLAEVPESVLATLKAREWFTWLPPAGFLPASGARRVPWQGFLEALQPARAVPLATGDAPAVLAQALCRERILLGGSSPKLRVYTLGSTVLFVRDAPNLRHAEEVWLDRQRADMPGGAEDVQAAIDELWGRSCAQLVVRPHRHKEADLHRMLADLKPGTDLMLCIEPGHLKLEQPLALRKLGHVTIHGHGPGSLLHCMAGEVALSVQDCESLHVSRIALQADRPGEGKDENKVGRRGALTVVDTPDVRIEEVRSECGEGKRLAAAAIVVTHREPEGKVERRVHVERCELRVGAFQQGLGCVHCDSVTLRDNLVVGTDPKRAMLAGIVVAGQLARHVRVQDNVVRGAMQGIKLALSRSEAIEEQKALPIEDAALVGNRIVLGGQESEENANRFGIMVGHALSLLVQDNGVDGSAMEASGLRLYGEYGLRLIVRDNHFTRLTAPIEIEVTGQLPQKAACLWLISSNIAQDAEQLILAKKEVMAVLRAGDNNVPRVT